MEGNNSEGFVLVKNPIQEPAQITEELETTPINFTPLSEKLIQWASKPADKAREAWRSIIDRNIPSKGKKPIQLSQDTNTGMTRRAFLASAAGVAATMLFPDIVGATTSNGMGDTQSEHNMVTSGGILTSKDYTPPNPSPDYLKGLESGFVSASKTFSDGSKIWPLDWNLRPIDPSDMVYNLPGQRSFMNFIRATHHLNLGRAENGRYAKVESANGTTTFCNVAASDMADMFQVSHTFSRFDENGRALLANQMHERIKSEASTSEKIPEVALIGREEAQKLANLGFPVFLSVKKERKTPQADYLNGHIGLITPRVMVNAKDPNYHPDAIYLVQAGSESGDAVYYDEEEKYTEENGYTKPLFAIDSRDLKDGRVILNKEMPEAY